MPQREAPYYTFKGSKQVPASRYGRTGRTSSTAVDPAVRRYVKRVVKSSQELKTYSGFSTATGEVIDYNGYAVSLYTNPNGGTTIVQGTSRVNYIGSRIKPEMLHMRYQIYFSDSYNTLRIAVVQFKGGALDILAASDYFSVTASTYAPLSFTELDHDDRYRILYDRYIGVDSANPLRVGEIKIPGSKLRYTEFEDASGTVEAGDIYLFIISDSSVEGHPTCKWSSRIYFRDE